MVALSFTTYQYWGSIRHPRRGVVVSLCTGTLTVWTVPTFKGTVSGSSTLYSSTQPLPMHSHPSLPVRRSDCLPSGCQRGWKVNKIKPSVTLLGKILYNYSSNFTSHVLSILSYTIEVALYRRINNYNMKAPQVLMPRWRCQSYIT